MQSLMGISASALGAFSVGMDVTANNIANMNTPGFKAGRAYYETGPQGYGVRPGEISHDTAPGAPMPVIPADTFVPNSEAYAMREGSNVSLEREFVTMIATEHAYTANASVIRSYDETLGTLLNLKV